MKRAFLSTLAIASSIGASQAAPFYYPDETQESLPLRWTVGVNLTWDDNVTPTVPSGTRGHEDDVVSINPYVGLSFVSLTPQTTIDVYARLGAIYYFDKPAASGSDDLYAQARVGANITHRVNERLRFTTRNFISYELEPDYSHGVATSRQTGEYLYWQTDNSVGYRWTERFATYTGFTLTGLDYESNVRDQDRFSWSLYNQFRYQLTPQTVLTLDYRYTDTDADGLAADSTDHFVLIGAEHRFSPNTIFVGRVGAQFRDVSGRGGDSTSPYAEAIVRSQINEQFSIRSFIRYGLESYDTVRSVERPVAGTFDVYDFTQRETLRLGVALEYEVSQALTIFGGVDYIPATFDDGRLVSAAAAATSRNGYDEDVFNAYIGVSMKFTENLYGTLSYNYTHSSSDFDSPVYAGDYNRNRVSLGVRAEF